MIQLNGSDQAKFEAGLIRARNAKLEVRELANGMFKVKNPSNGHQHLVISRGLLLECSCDAGQHDVYCMHRAQVRQHCLDARAEAEQEMANQANERLAEQRNEQALYNTLWTTDQAIAAGKADEEAANLPDWMHMTRDERAAWLATH